MIFDLPGFDFEVPVVEDGPAFDQKAMVIVIRSAGIPEPAFRHQVPGHFAGRPDDLLCRIAAVSLTAAL